MYTFGHREMRLCLPVLFQYREEPDSEMSAEVNQFGMNIFANHSCISHNVVSMVALAL